MALPPQLNERQRRYLLAIFETDQEAEEQQRELRALPWRPGQKHEPASVWRWLEHSEGVSLMGIPPSPLWKRIKALKLLDPGTGSTFAALADRGLVEVNWAGTNAWGHPKPHVRMTLPGRRLARQLSGTQVHRPPPPGSLREWHWRALARAYAAGDEGLVAERWSGDYGRIGWNTWLRLRDYKRGALVMEVAGRLHITHAGKSVYEQEFARYSTLFPHIEAPAPAV